MPLEASGLTEVKTFQKIFPDFQIYNLSKENFNSVIYQGPEGGISIYLYLHDQHFDVITKVTGFLNRSYFSFQCKKGYNTKEKKVNRKVQGVPQSQTAVNITQIFLTRSTILKTSGFHF